MFRTGRRSSPAVALAASICVVTGLALPVGAADDEPAAPEAKPAESSETRPAPADAPKSRGIAEITVTGRRREERLQSTPLLMIAISDEELESRQFNNITDVTEAAANVRFDTTNGSNSETRVFIRGVGQDD